MLLCQRTSGAGKLLIAKWTAFNTDARAVPSACVSTSTAAFDDTKSHTRTLLSHDPVAKKVTRVGKRLFEEGPKQVLRTDSC